MEYLLGKEWWSYADAPPQLSQATLGIVSRAFALVGTACRILIGEFVSRAFARMESGTTSF